jgi:hypothetical protein
MSLLSVLEKSPTWALALHAGSDNFITFQDGKPFFRRKKSLSRPFDIQDVVEVITLKESEQFRPRTTYLMVLRLKDKRFALATSVRDQHNNWIGRTYLAWNLKTLMAKAMTTQTVAELKLTNKSENTGPVLIRVQPKMSLKKAKA